MLRPLHWLAALAVLAACSEPPTVSDCVAGLDPDCESPTEDEIVAGVNLTALFATPTPAEIDTALDAVGPATPATASLTEAAPAVDGVRQVILRLDDGEGRIVSALARIPGPSGATTPLPVVVILTDGVDGASDADFLTAPGFGRIVDGAVQVVVAYRGERLALAGDSLAATRPGRPYLDDVPDVRAVLGHLSLIPRADTSRLALLGVGRGGTVGLLAAPGTGVDAVVSLGAVTDLFADSFRDAVRTTLTGNPPDPAPSGFDQFVRPALDLRNSVVDLADARIALVALSPARLRAADRLPAVLALLGADDTVVGADQLEALAAVLATSSGPARIAAVVDGVGRGELLGRASVQSQIAGFLSDALFP